jgi:hypothetical protein
MLHVNVAAGFSLRFPSSDEFVTISCKLRNLKVAATRPYRTVRSGGQKSLNLDSKK